MTTRSRFTSVGAFLLTLLVAVAAAAGPIDKRTTFTFNTPVAIPGVTLPAGSYVFHLTDIDSHQVVQVLGRDGKTPYAMFFALQDWRATVARDPELTFIETAADMPHAIRTWWSAGDSIGYEFLYPRAQAALLARGSGTPVRATEAEVPRWIEPQWIPPTFIEAEPPLAAAEPAAEPAAIPEPPLVTAEATPVAALPTTASPLTVMLATAIVLIALAASMQLFTMRKHS